MLATEHMYIELKNMILSVLKKLSEISNLQKPLFRQARRSEEKKSVIVEKCIFFICIFKKKKRSRSKKRK